MDFEVVVLVDDFVDNVVEELEDVVEELDEVFELLLLIDVEVEVVAAASRDKIVPPAAAAEDLFGFREEGILPVLEPGFPLANDEDEVDLIETGERTFEVEEVLDVDDASVVKTLDDFKGNEGFALYELRADDDLGTVEVWPPQNLALE